MSFTRFLAVAKKEIVQVLRDSRSLIIVIVMPVILVLLFGYGANLDLKHLPIYVHDRDGSQQSQDLLKRFQASDYFEIVRVVNSYRDLARAIDDGHAKWVVSFHGTFRSPCALAVPHKFRRWLTLQTTTLQTC
jgi:ABC-2 type transport system permease protein